jgi:hypothetical protein
MTRSDRLMVGILAGKSRDGIRRAFFIIDERHKFSDPKWTAVPAWAK